MTNMPKMHNLKPIMMKVQINPKLGICYKIMQMQMSQDHECQRLNKNFILENNRQQISIHDLRLAVFYKQRYWDYWQQGLDSSNVSNLFF